MVSAKKIAQAKKAKAAAAASASTAAAADDGEAPPAMRANVARHEHDEYTPIEDILADYVENNSTTMARSLVARLHIAGGPPPDPPPSPPDLNYDESSDEDDDQCGPAHDEYNDEYSSEAAAPTPPEATEHEPETVQGAPPTVQAAPSTCAFPGCTRPPHVDLTGVAHQCCGRTCAAALLVYSSC